MTTQRHRVARLLAGRGVLWRLLGRNAILAVCLVVVRMLPEGPEDYFVRVQHAAVALIVVIAIGTTLYDTLFYSRLRM
ncbi:MAG TPA: hypothetical protein VGS41_01690 [Chthonomonadales bacterium]|nr:hypothetical protein [Chthonomonadales bacterium]